MKKIFKFFWEELTMKISDTHVIEMSGFIIVLIIFLLGLFLGEYFNLFNINGFKNF